MQRCLKAPTASGVGRGLQEMSSEECTAITMHGLPPAIINLLLDAARELQTPHGCWTPVEKSARPGRHPTAGNREFQHTPLYARCRQLFEVCIQPVGMRGPSPEIRPTEQGVPALLPGDAWRDSRVHPNPSRDETAYGRGPQGPATTAIGVRGNA